MMARIVAISVRLFCNAKVKRMIPVLSCRTPMSEIYDLLKLSECFDFESEASPKDFEKPTGLTRACMPVMTADIANIMLTA